MSAAVSIRRRDYDLALVLLAVALCLISVIGISSATATEHPELMMRQVIWIGIGVLAYLAVSSRSYVSWLNAVWPFYGAATLLLAVVSVAGTVKLGASRWIMLGALSIQPSELAKLATACALARYLGARPSPLSWRAIFGSAMIAGIPALLVFIQPDLGTSSILLAMWVLAVWVAGIPGRVLGGLAGAAAALSPLAWHVLKDYQKERLTVFLNPHADPLGAGYTIIQAQIAIGSGQWFGRGWLSGTQNQLNFLPEHHTDFLYAVIAEEWGLLGAGLVIALWAWLVIRALRIAQGNSEPQGRCLAAALAAWLGYQAAVNLGMVMGSLPVVGVPLPLVSYGGSAMVTTWMAIGLLQSIRRFGTYS